MQVRQGTTKDTVYPAMYGQSRQRIAMDNRRGEGMIIRKAETAEYDAVRAFYHSVIDAMEGRPYHPMWQKDIYPAPEELRAATEDQTMYIGLTDNRIAAAMVINHKYNEGYCDAAWPEKLRTNEFVVIHMLCVHSDFTGNGFAKQLVAYAIHLAREAGMKAVRLDVLKGNIPAERLYEAMGFRCVDTVKMFYEDTGCVDFQLYELEIA